jgi:predicted DNA-binding transcriptional regulator AlpA
MQQAAYSVTQFCAAHGIARTTLYELFRQKRGPRTMKVGRRVLISAEAAADWRKRMEDDSAAGDSGPGFVVL